jgi:iron(III) transport system permease protein
MSEHLYQKSAIAGPAPALKSRALDVWSLGALAIAVLVLLPVAAVIWLALTPTENIWPHLLSTTLPRYLGNTLVLMLSVGVLTGIVGHRHGMAGGDASFSGPQLVAMGFAHALGRARLCGGLCPCRLSGICRPGADSPARDLWLANSGRLLVSADPDPGAAILVLSAALYPYVYLLARAAFREQSGSAYEVARALGVGPWGRFLRVGLPLARPAIAAGVAVVMMETVNDYGTVEYFAVQTLTTGIFSVWLQAGNLGGAAQIAACVLVLIVLLVTLEKISRRKSRFFGNARGLRPVTSSPLRGGPAALATLACLLPFAIGFVVPVDGTGQPRAGRWPVGGPRAAAGPFA